MCVISLKYSLVSPDPSLFDPKKKQSINSFDFCLIIISFYEKFCLVKYHFDPDEYRYLTILD